MVRNLRKEINKITRGNEYGIPGFDKDKHEISSFFAIAGFGLENDKRNFIEYVEKYIGVDNNLCYKLSENFIYSSHCKNENISLDEMEIYAKEDVIINYLKYLEMQKSKINNNSIIDKNKSLNEIEVVNAEIAFDNESKSGRTYNVHQTYIAIMKFYNNLLEEKVIRQFTKEDTKNEVKSFFILKEGEKVDDIFVGTAFDNFWKIFPEKYKAGPGNPNYKKK